MIPKEARAELAAFRGQHEAARASCLSLPDKSEPIDWDLYRKNISKAGLVDSFQKQFDAVKIPYPKDTKSAEIAKKEQEFEVLAQKEIAEAKKRIQNLQDQLAKLKSEKPYEEMTVDEYLADKPELRRQIDNDIKNHHWA